MRPLLFQRPWLLALLALAALLASFDGTLSGGGSGLAETGSAEETQQLLQGTWLREAAADGIQARRILVLGAGGRFQESVRVTDAEGREHRYEHEGTWLFDGTNLKRKYTLMDGKPPSRLNVPFATFQLAIESRNAFTGTDNIRGHVVRYTRVDDGTRP